MVTRMLEASVVHIGNVFCMPITLLINFALFQYLVGMFYKRRREPRIAMLLFCAFMGFASIIPFSHPDREVYEALDDVSELCSTLTFLIQITILGRDVNKKLRIRMLKWMAYLSELLSFVGIILALVTFANVFVKYEMHTLSTLDHVFEDIALVFIFGFRFYCMGMSRGFRDLLRTRKLEIVLYLLYMTHEYPFTILEAETHVSWLPIQALWNRITVLMCILLTIREKVRQRGQSARSKMSHGPSMSGMNLTTSAGSDMDVKKRKMSKEKSHGPRAGSVPKLGPGRSGLNLSSVHPVPNR
ncbi:hypothetical protein Poli38472_013355 [Pythium oligandrum]|uniref:Uncharacterized protein n=1 Tax=Pythium oligandrum TaxID=41045 RepID=A0A8K1C7K5_PYTOL|nr:hypothetical protein Poli38472_013355 [Pythium oligandrum]|eukprot:TMW57881.1 hypothetical protein Poli38472_013355 [Pythium oligandrum]